MKNLLMIVLVLSTFSAFGQYTGSIVHREGFVIGIGVGVGVISVADSNQENAFDDGSMGISLPNLKMGFMLSERMALLATFPGMIYEHESKDRSFQAVIPSLQYWVNDRWWVNGGIGLAIDMPALYEIDEIEDEDFNLGCAVAFSTGYEIWQTEKFALDLQSQLHMGRTNLGDDLHRDGVTFSIGIGFNWY